MSNVVDVTPYAQQMSDALEQAADAIATERRRHAVHETLTRASDLLAPTSAQRDAVRSATDHVRESRRRERLARTSAGGTVAKLTLQSPDPSSLVCTAESLGYRASRLSTGETRLWSSGASEIVLRATGRGTEVIAFARADATRLVREHTRARAVEHLEERGFAVRVSKARNDEIRIEGVERAGERGKVDVQIRNDGRLRLDVDCVQGDRCGKIAADLAAAVGGQITGSSRKPDFFTPMHQRARQGARGRG